MHPRRTAGGGGDRSLAIKERCQHEAHRSETAWMAAIRVTLG